MVTRTHQEVPLVNEMNKKILAVFGALALAVAIFVAPVVSSKPIATASAHAFNSQQICGAFFDGKKNIYHPTHFGRYVSHSRSGLTYRVGYVFYAYAIPGSTHSHFATCTYPSPPA